MTWQPIETAPKDVALLVYIDFATPRYRIQIAEWDGEDGAYEYGWWSVAGGGLLKPSHWMPLPLPPEEPSPVVPEKANDSPGAGVVDKGEQERCRPNNLGFCPNCEREIVGVMTPCPRPSRQKATPSEGA
jgi:hypothetical protein